MNQRVEIILPEGVGTESDEPVLSGWLYDDGDDVEAGVTVAEVMIAKTTVEIEAPVSGILRHVAELEAVLTPNAVIGLIEIP